MKILWVVPCVVMMASAVVTADPCDKDRSITCNDVIPGDGHVYDCLIGRMDRVAPACADATRRAGQLADAVVVACRSDAERWCAQVANKGRVAVVDCVKAHRDKITENCKSKYRQFKAFGFDIRS